MEPSFPPGPSTLVQTAGVDHDLSFTERCCQLTIMNGAHAGKSVDVNKNAFTVGKDVSCDLQIVDATVSRQHFTIEQHQGAYLIKDDGSTNGTWIDQFRIREAYLRPGVVVRAGQVELKFEQLFKAIALTPSKDERFGALVGRSPRMRRLFTMLERVARTDATVVILGETGTGKSAIAKAIHDASARKAGPFVTVDCGSIAENLIESELFGHEKGAFTGAAALRKGALEQSDGGTLFIDELVDLRLDLQPRLLRVLEEREVRRVGGNQAIKLDVRIIAASRFDLWHEVEEHKFREDLYFRLAVFTIPLPSLRDRKGDIPLLARNFAASLRGGERLLPRLTDDVLERLSNHPFPGNVRELRNVIERAVHLDCDPNEMLGHLTLEEDGFQSPPPTATPIAPFARVSESVTEPLPRSPRSTVADREPVQPEPVPLPPPPPEFTLVVESAMPFKDAKEKLLEEFEAEYFRRLLEQAGGNASAIARLAGIDRKHVYTLAKKHGFDLKANRGRDDE